MNSTNQARLPVEGHFPNIERRQSELLPLLARSGTPIFLGEREILVDRYKTLVASMSEHWGKHVVGYSFKTNYLVAKSAVFQECGAWAEVVSGREYRLARELNFPGEKIIFNGPLKTDDDLRQAISERALINVNDHGELGRLLKISAEGRTSVNVGLRLSSSLPKLGHSRFGFSMENAEATMAVERIRLSRSLNLVGVHSHLYGDTDDANMYSLAARRLGEFAKVHIPDYQQKLKFIDMGGGFPAHGPHPKSRQTWNPQSIDVYVRAIAEALRPFFPDANARPTLILEPGRYLTCDGIVFMTRVIHVNERNEKQVVNCDGSISMLPLTHYSPQIIRVYTCELQERRGHEMPTTIHGSTCRENDVLYEGPFPSTQPGDYLVHFAAGAYNSSLCPDFIFKAPALELF